MNCKKTCNLCKSKVENGKMALDAMNNKCFDIIIISALFLMYDEIMWALYFLR